MLRFETLRETQAPTERWVGLLKDFRRVLAEQGMASMDEYGDMLKWALPGGDGVCRYFHVFHPGFCSWSDELRATVHDHGGSIQGIVLLGAMDHHTYRPTVDPDGDRSYAGVRYRLERHTNHQVAGTAYALPSRVPHWLVPTQLTLTYFEEEDNDIMGDLVDPIGADADEHPWEQADADALLPELLAQVDARIEALQVTA